MNLTKPGKITVLVVDDSTVIRSFLTGILNADEGIRVIAAASSGADALNVLTKTRPDVITMDINMPGMDGFEATRQIMQHFPTPIVIVSGNYHPSEVAIAFKALEAGAVAILPRPSGVMASDFSESSKKFIRTIKLMSEIRVVRRFSRMPVKKDAIPIVSKPEPADGSILPKPAGIRIIVIGASAGGPQVLMEIIKEIPDHFPLPILIVQHIDAGFAAGFAMWLEQITGKRITIASHGTDLSHGGIFLPPADQHMGIGPDGNIALSNDPPDRSLRPSVAHLFRSALRVYGNRVLAILLTGMGTDGAKELKSLKEAGSITIAQDATTSLVHGMPGEAIRLGGTTHVLSPEQIIQFIKNL